MAHTKKWFPEVRYAAIMRLLEGETLEAVAADHEVTRERLRQVLWGSMKSAWRHGENKALPEVGRLEARARTAIEKVFSLKQARRDKDLWEVLLRKRYLDEAKEGTSDTQVGSQVQVGREGT